MGLLLFFPGSWYTQSFVCAIQESVSPVLCKFRQFYGGVNGDLLQKSLCHTQVCCTQSPCSCGRPLLTHASTETPEHLRASLNQSRLMSLLLSFGSWCTRFCCALQESISQFCLSSSSSMVGLMVTSSKRAHAIPKSAAPRAPVPAADHCRPVPPQETLKHSLYQSLWGPWVLVHTRFI